MLSIETGKTALRVFPASTLRHRRAVLYASFDVGDRGTPSLRIVKCRDQTHVGRDYCPPGAEFHPRLSLSADARRVIRHEFRADTRRVGTEGDNLRRA